MFVTSCGCVLLSFFFFKQKTAYEMRISDWSSDVCSSDLLTLGHCLLGSFLATPCPLPDWDGVLAASSDSSLPGGVGESRLPTRSGQPNAHPPDRKSGV